MMLGRLLEEPQQLPEKTQRIVQVQRYADGLAVCLDQPVQVHASAMQGSYQLLLFNTWGQTAQGELLLAGKAPVRWQLQSDGSMMRITFIGLQAIAGRWHQRLTDAGHWCADIAIKVRED